MITTAERWVPALLMWVLPALLFSGFLPNSLAQPLLSLRCPSFPSPHPSVLPSPPLTASFCLALPSSHRILLSSPPLLSPHPSVLPSPPLTASFCLPLPSSHRILLSYPPLLSLHPSVLPSPPLTSFSSQRPLLRWPSKVQDFSVAGGERERVKVSQTPAPCLSNTSILLRPLLLAPHSRSQIKSLFGDRECFAGGFG
eukprot:358504-Hanusia_phi.AAC.1